MAFYEISYVILCVKAKDKITTCILDKATLEDKPNESRDIGGGFDITTREASFSCLISIATFSDDDSFIILILYFRVIFVHCGKFFHIYIYICN